MGNYELRDKKRNKRADDRDESRFYTEKKKGKKSRKKVQEDRRNLDDFSRSLEKVFAKED